MGSGVRVHQRCRSAWAVVALCWALAAGAQPVPAHAQPVKHGGVDAAAWSAQLGPFMQAAVTEHGYLGGVGLVLHQGREVWLQAAGHQDLARRWPLRSDAIFRIYSMSKPLASLAALQLVAQGRLQLNDAVALHLPAFARLQVWAGGTAAAPQLRAPVRVMTVRHLLTHTAGFATGGAGIAAPSVRLNAVQLERSSNLSVYAARVASVPLASDPGQRFRYDGVNTEVLGALVEAVAGRPLHALLQDHVLGPLGMVDTGFEVPAAQRGRLVDLTHISASGTLQRLPGQQRGTRLRPYDSGAGGLYATARDYGRFCQLLLDGGTLAGVEVLPRPLVDVMMSNQLEQTDPPAGLPPQQFRPGEGFGLGGAVVLDAAAAASALPAGSFGWAGAASTYFTVHRPSQLCAVLLLQHLPHSRSGAHLPKLQHAFFQRVHQVLVPATAVLTR